MLAGMVLNGAVQARADGHDKDKFIALGTSSKSGVYFPVGSAICDQVNKGRDQHLVRCT